MRKLKWLRDLMSTVIEKNILVKINTEKTLNYDK